jgi:hypothetical protein
MAEPFMAPVVRIACCALALLANPQSASADPPPTFADRPDEDVRDADRTFSVLLNPLAMAVGLYGGEADFVLGRHVAVAVEGALYRRGEATGELLGAGLLVYPLGGPLHRLYFEPRVAYAHPAFDPAAKLDWSDDVLGLGATAGWQWTWDYGLSVRIGGGAMYFLGDSHLDPSSGSLAVGPRVVLDGCIGWAF